MSATSAPSGNPPNSAHFPREFSAFSGDSQHADRFVWTASTTRKSLQRLVTSDLQQYLDIVVGSPLRARSAIPIGPLLSGSGAKNSPESLGAKSRFPDCFGSYRGCSAGEVRARGRSRPSPCRRIAVEGKPAKSQFQETDDRDGSDGFSLPAEPRVRARPIGPARASADRSGAYTPKPRGSRPSIAALTMPGARNASERVMRIERSVLPSRAAIVSKLSSG